MCFCGVLIWLIISFDNLFEKKVKSKVWSDIINGWMYEMDWGYYVVVGRIVGFGYYWKMVKKIGWLGWIIWVNLWSNYW